ncbi:MAG: hypothetical protein SFT81_03890 [Candidatus Caenarcaniphilales bacterium]|nr:hypothetical protein [Candidatus Caenarcaniphilales bacterium]
MKKKANLSIDLVWSKEDQCLIATLNESDLIGCGLTEQEAIGHLLNHLKDEKDTPRVKQKKVDRHATNIKLPPK